MLVFPLHHPIIDSKHIVYDMYNIYKKIMYSLMH